MEGSVPGGGWPGLGAELRSQVAQGQRQCQELQDKLAASEATVRAQAEQLEKYHVLLRELKARVGWERVLSPVRGAGVVNPARGALS